MRHQVVWAKCSVTNPKTNEDVTLKRGDMLPGWVSDFTRFVLTTSGAVAVVEGADPDPVEAAPEPVRLAEHPPPNQPQPDSAASTGQQPQSSPTVPTAKSTKQELVDFGVQQGGDRAELEKLKVDELRDRFVPKQ